MTVVDLVQKLKKGSSLSGQRGQAMIEYVLMLVVSVALVLALGYQLFKPFQAFVKSYMGDYVSCLLETGELPSLGSDDAQEQLAEEGCNARFDAASVASGRPPKGSSSSSASSSKSDSSKDGTSDSESSGGSSGDSTSASSSDRGGNLLVSSMNKRNATEMAADNGKVTEIPLADASGSKFYNRQDSWGDNRSGSSTGKTTALGIAGMTEDEKKKNDRKSEAKRAVAVGENFAPPPKKITIQKPEAKAPTIAEDDAMTFGNFFRFLLIAAIIIALLVVLGSQALKISKSREE